MSFDHKDILTNSYTFQYSWESVVKGFWLKYPNKKISNVIFNKVIDMEIIDNTKLLIKRMMFTKFLFFWGHSIETIILDLEKRNLSIVSTITKRSKISPHGKEICVYQAINDDFEEKDSQEKKTNWKEEEWKRKDEEMNSERRERGERTLYTKELFSYVKIMKMLENLNHTFKTGCSIVEELSRNFENNKNL